MTIKSTTSQWTDDKIFICDNVLTRAECNNCRLYFYRNRWEKQEHEDTYFLDVDECEHILLHQYRDKIFDKANELFGNLEVEWSHVVEWSEGHGQNYHIDEASTETVLTSITYLNDDYDGGETLILGDMAIFPRTGRTVFFNGRYYGHGVNAISNGTRYTLSTWYKKKV